MNTSFWFRWRND